MAVKLGEAMAVGERIVTPLRKIGHGGNADVFEARLDDASHPLVALKILRTPQAKDRRRKYERFLREADALRRVDNPFVTRIIAGGPVNGGNGSAAIVMELADGTLRDLSSWLWRGPGRRCVTRWMQSTAGPQQRSASATLPLVLVLDVVLQMINGIDAVHAAGLVHRDLKPENVLLRRNWTVAIGDLGLVADRAQEPLTASGEMVGNRDYWAPEQRQSGGPISPATDHFAVGMMLGELLSGLLPRGYFGPDEQPQNLFPALWTVTQGLLAADPRRRSSLAAVKEGLWGAADEWHVRADLEVAGWLTPSPAHHLWDELVRRWDEHARVASLAISRASVAASFDFDLLFDLRTRGRMVERHEPRFASDVDEVAAIARRARIGNYGERLAALRLARVIAPHTWTAHSRVHHGYVLTPMAERALSSGTKFDADVELQAGRLVPPTPRELFNRGPGNE